MSRMHRLAALPAPALALALVATTLTPGLGCGGGASGRARGGTTAGPGMGSSAAGPLTFDASDLGPEELARFQSLAAGLSSPCDPTQATSLAASLDSASPACPSVVYAARRIARAITAGEPDERIARQHRRKYFDAPATFTLEKAPFEGLPDAPVVLVEFFDYDCGYCKLFMAVLEQIEADYPSEIRVHFKHFPLSIHPDSELAARAAVAAQRQGKFTAMHRTLLANQGRHTEEDVLGYARAIGLDAARFQADLESEDVRAQVALDRAEGERAGLEGTPTLFIDGRVCETLSVPDIGDWIREVLDAAGNQGRSPAR